jgi:maltokinase
VKGPAGLGERVLAAGPELVRSDRAGFAADPVSLPLRLTAELDLGGGRFVGVVADAVGARWTVPIVDDGHHLRRAVAGDGVAEALVARLDPAREPLSDKDFRLTRWHGEPVAGERAIAVDQTNESVVVGERAVVKWALRLPAAGEEVRHPAPDRLAALAAAGFDGTARPWGVLEYRHPAQPLLLATVTAFLPGARDGWDWAVEEVRAFARGEVTLDASLASSAAVGELVARMHLGLAGRADGPGRSQLHDAAAARWAADARADLADALDLVDGEEGDRLAARADAIAGGLAPLADAAGTPVIDVHGDLHVGQILRYGGQSGAPSPGYAVVDFDGNPVLSPADRLVRRPAAVDVAGMLASLDHVGRVVVRRTTGVDVAQVGRWIAAAERAFLDAYVAELDRAGAADLLDVRLLRPARLQQECREFRYAVRHLPHWRYVPDAALGALVDAEEKR